MMWPGSKRNIYAKRAAEQRFEQQQLLAVEIAQAANIAMTDPKNLKQLVPKRYRNVRSKSLNRNSEVDREAAIQRAEEIRRMSGSGSSIHKKNGGE